MQAFEKIKEVTNVFVSFSCLSLCLRMNTPLFDRNYMGACFHVPMYIFGLHIILDDYRWDMSARP